MTNGIRRNYHWVIALLVFMEMIIFGGLLNCHSLFVIPVCEDLEITRGSYSLALVKEELEKWVFPTQRNTQKQHCSNHKR